MPLINLQSFEKNAMFRILIADVLFLRSGLQGHKVCNLEEKVWMSVETESKKKKGCELTECRGELTHN